MFTFNTSSKCEVLEDVGKHFDLPNNFHKVINKIRHLSSYLCIVISETYPSLTIPICKYEIKLTKWEEIKSGRSNNDEYQKNGKTTTLQLYIKIVRPCNLSQLFISSYITLRTLSPPSSSTNKVSAYINQYDSFNRFKDRCL